MAKILVIDDEKLSRITVRKILEQSGHKVFEAASGNDGIASFRSQQAGQPFDVVITDIIMPDKEGVETIMDLRRLSAKIPIIAMSGGGRTGNLDFLKLAEQRGANSVLAKPFSPEELLSTVAGLIQTA